MQAIKTFEESWIFEEITNDFMQFMPVDLKEQSNNFEQLKKS